MKKIHDIELDDAGIIEDEITRNGMSLEANSDTFPFDPAVPRTAFPFMENEARYYVPRYQKMTDYLNIHFSLTLGNQICKQINCEKIEGAPDTCTIIAASFWKEDYTSFVAELSVEMDVLYTGDQSRCRTETYITRVLINMDEETVTFLDKVHDMSYRYEHSSKDVLLSDYLVPIFSANAIEEHAEDMLYSKANAAYNDLTKNKATKLASTMGLNVVRYPVHKSEKHSTIFFKEGSIQVDCPQENGDVLVQRVKIPADTVVMNTNGKLVDNGRLDLFHECFHYEWHFCFNKLRELHQRDIRQLPEKHVLVNSHTRGRKKRSPLQWAEWQARRGAFGLLVPRSIMSRKLHEELSKHSEKDWHMGKKLDVALRSIAEDFDMAKGHMRGRAIQLGYIEAKGALNYVDRRYIEPFAFDPENGGGNYTFVLDSKELFEVYQKSKKLQKQLFDQVFVYVDGHICKNNPAFVESIYGGGKLTKWANAHVDRCCLRFTHVYEENEEDYSVGTLNSDDSYERYYLGFIDDASEEAQEKRLGLIRKRIENMPGSFSDALIYLMEEYSSSVIALADATTLSVKTIQRLRNDLRYSYPLDWVIALCVGMHLEPPVSAAFLARAGYDLRLMPQSLVYQFILSCKFTHKISDIQLFLKEHKYKELALGCSDD